MRELDRDRVNVQTKWKKFYPSEIDVSPVLEILDAADIEAQALEVLEESIVNYNAIMVGL